MNAALFSTTSTDAQLASAITASTNAWPCALPSNRRSRREAISESHQDERRYVNSDSRIGTYSWRVTAVDCGVLGPGMCEAVINGEVQLTLVETLAIAFPGASITLCEESIHDSIDYGRFMDTGELSIKPATPEAKFVGNLLLATGAGALLAAGVGAWQMSRIALAEAGAAAATGPTSRSLLSTAKDLQKFFTKHGSDFGLSGNWNPTRIIDASRVLNQHINSAGVKVIQGAYHGATGFTHYLDVSTRLNVVVNSAGYYVTAYRLSPEQLSDVLTKQHLF